MGFLYHCTALYGPWVMESGHDVQSMGHGEKVAERCALEAVSSAVNTADTGD